MNYGLYCFALPARYASAPHRIRSIPPVLTLCGRDWSENAKAPSGMASWTPLPTIKCSQARESRPRLRASPLLQHPLAQCLGDLHGVKRGTLAQVVTDAPQVQPILDGGILPDAADERGEIAHAFLGRHVATRLALVDHHDTRAFAQDVAGLVLIEELLKLNIDCLGMTHKHRHPHTGRRDFDRGVHDLLGLDHHLPLFLGRAVFHEDVYMWNDVEGDVFRELRGRHF